MGYAIKKVSYKKGPQWKLQFITYDKASAVKSNAKAPRKIKDIPKLDWRQHGFDFAMTYEQAKSQATSLNKQAEVRRWAETKTKIRERLQAEDTVASAFLPEHLVSEFETEILFEKMCRGNADVKMRNKTESHWRATKRVIRDIKLHPSDWSDRAYKFTNLYVAKRMSPSYVQKVQRILNYWGYFVCKKEAKAFLPLPSPRGMDAQRIADAYFDKTPSGEGHKSAPLSPEALERAKSHLPLDNYNWLLISVWFGLRPAEIDGLSNKKNWQIITNIKGRTQLRVYQPKLRAVAKSQRWKIIPVIYPEQRKILSLIEGGMKCVRRPILKVMRNHFTEGITLYGGRKNFTDMMLNKGHKFEQISQWMGHTTLDRTYRDYKNRLKTNLEDFDEAG